MVFRFSYGSRGKLIFGLKRPMKPYVVLGVYHPVIWKSWRVGRDLTRMTRELGLKPHVDPKHGPLHSVPWYSEELHAEVRRRTFKTKQAEGWHYDGDTT